MQARPRAVLMAVRTIGGCIIQIACGGEDFVREKKIREKGKAAARVRTLETCLWAGLILVQMTVVVRLDAWASEEEIVRQEIVCQEEREIVRQVTQEVFYEAVEGVEKLPLTVEVVAEYGGEEKAVVCSAVEVTTVGEARWQDGFALPVTLQPYDADWYQLGEQLVPAELAMSAATPADAADVRYGELLLADAGLSPEEYRIDAIRWDGEVYLDASGVLCRNALASGQKLVRDYHVKYCGEVRFAAPAAAETPAETEAAVPETEAETASAAQETGMSAPSESEAGIAPESWSERIVDTLLIVIGIGALFFFGGLLLLALRSMAKAWKTWYDRKKKDRSDHHVHRK